MEQKTIIHAEEGKQDLTITRTFELPVDLLFRAYTEAAIVEQWMGTKVIKLENKQHGGYRFETSDNKGNVVFSANGSIHDIVDNKKIVRTFEMENAPFDVQLEYISFEAIDDENSKLIIHSIYKSAALRDQMLKLPFAQGINKAHNRLQDMVQKLNRQS